MMSLCQYYYHISGRRLAFLPSINVDLWARKKKRRHCSEMFSYIWHFHSQTCKVRAALVQYVCSTRNTWACSYRGHAPVLLMVFFFSELAYMGGIQMIMQEHDENRRKAVIWGPHGNHTKQHALTIATELAREYSGDSNGAGAGLWLLDLIQSTSAARHQEGIHSHCNTNNQILHLWINTDTDTKHCGP